MIRSISNILMPSDLAANEKQNLKIKHQLKNGPADSGQTQTGSNVEEKGSDWPLESESGQDAFHSLAPDVLQATRRTLIEQETAFQRQLDEATSSSLWAHSLRVGRIAVYIAEKEGCPTDPALLAGLFHDLGKFAGGRYHADDTPEEANAVVLAERIIAGTDYEKWFPTIKEAILSCYLDGETTSPIGRIVFDADCLDKLGNMGVAQFFAKKAMRRRFLDDDLMIRMSVELTYAYHAPQILKTPTGRVLAKQKSFRTRRFYSELVEEWNMLGLGDLTIMEEDIAGIVCVFVVPRSCACGGRMNCNTDIEDTVKCRSAIVSYRCVKCSAVSEFSFCLPNINGLPLRKQQHRVSCG